MEVQSLVALQIQEGRVEASLKNWSNYMSIVPEVTLTLTVLKRVYPVL